MAGALLSQVKNGLKKSDLIMSCVGKLRRAKKPLWLYMMRNTTAPLSDCYGADRGTPLDRYYIEGFLDTQRPFIKGACLEIRDNTYTKAFGGDKVTSSDILDIEADNKDATLIADLRNMPSVSSDRFDSIILTQVLLLIDDVQAAISEVYRVLKPGGSAIVTIPAVSRIDVGGTLEGDFWRFTEASARFLFKNFKEVEITSYGNCRSSIYFLAGAALEEVPKRVLEPCDRQFPVIIAVRATK